MKEEAKVITKVEEKKEVKKPVADQPKGIAAWYLKKPLPTKKVTPPVQQVEKTETIKTVETTEPEAIKQK